MFTPSHRHSASVDAKHIAFRDAAEAREQARAPATAARQRGSRAAWPRHLGRLAAAVTSVLISIGLLGSVVMGLTSMAHSAGMTLAKTSPAGCDLFASKPVCSPIGLKA